MVNLPKHIYRIIVHFLCYGEGKTVVMSNASDIIVS